MLHWIWVLIVGGVIGLIAGALTGHGKSMNWIANILAGLVGSSLGQALLGGMGTKGCGHGNCTVNFRCSYLGNRRCIHYE